MLSKLLDKFNLRRLKKEVTDEYSKYLDLQYERSVGKYCQKSIIEKNRKNELVEITAKHVNLSQINDALIIGCRNSYELDLLESHGVKRTVGVDLFTHDSRIKVMDMHELKYDDSSFDLVYCSHALEHAFNPEKARSEMVRVLRPGGVIVVEVPINYETRGADMHDFGSAENIITHFENICRVTVVFKDNVAKGSNFSGTAVARLIIKIVK